MSVFSGNNAARLLELLKQELELFGEIYKLTEEQKELLEAGEIGEFDESLDRRQTRIEKINGLHQESDALMQSYMSYSNTEGVGSIREIDEVAGQLRNMIVECAVLNEKVTSDAKEKAEEYVERIDKLSLSRKSLGSYIQTVSNDPELFDKMT